MCQDCGCSEIQVNTPVVPPDKAVQNRSLFSKHKSFCVNIQGSPGSGKTTLIELIALGIDPSKILVIQGDLESDVDKKRLMAQGIDTFQINTHSGCHLNAQMISDALVNIDLEGKDYVFIENVGNLVCPAGVDIGQHLNIVVSSTPEGEDKPTKYSHIFHHAHCVVLTKWNLHEAVHFNRQLFSDNIQRIKPQLRIISVGNTDAKEFVQFINHQREHAFNIPHSH